MAEERSGVCLPCGRISTSRASARGENAASGRRGSVSIGRSLRLCTARSIRPSSSAWSSSRTKSPFPPILSSGRSRIRSPVVFIVTSSTSSSGWARRICPITSILWAIASLLSRLPTRTLCFSIHFLLFLKQALCAGTHYSFACSIRSSSSRICLAACAARRCPVLLAVTPATRLPRRAIAGK